MHLNPESDWNFFIKNEFRKPYFNILEKILDLEYAKNICYPPYSQILDAFNFCELNNLKVVIIGQDPYHGTGEANGLSFSVNDGIKIPPSLRNIYRELSNDLEKLFLPTSGNLACWAQQGVLLLNATLTVRKDCPNSHKHLNWQEFTDSVIAYISDNKSEVVFMLWGNFAQKKGIKIDRQKHLVLQSGHPSPMSANQGKWFGNKHFSTANNYLKSVGKHQIEW